MAQKDYQDIPAHCPVSGQRLYVSEVRAEDDSITIRGRFRVPAVGMLDRPHQEFLEVFLRSRGVISTVEKELGISYPTVRSRLDALLDALELQPVKSERKADKLREKTAEAKRRVLAELEDGRISAEEAKRQLKEVGAK
jgi:hypothetical protein